MTTRWMGKLAAVLTASLLTGCQLTPTIGLNGAASGALHFRFQTPAKLAAPLAFSLQAVPAGTNRFEVEISGQGLAQPLKSNFEIGGGESQSRTINGLPVGPKTVRVSALLNQEVLASASTEVSIEAGKTAQAQLDLQALRAEVTARLEQSLPLDLGLKLKITGAGLEAPLEKTVTIATGETSASLGSLPLGAKQIEIEMVATAGSQSVTAPATSTSLNVVSGGNALEISAGKVLSAFSDDLESLLSKANPLAVLAWLTALRADPARLREYFFLLPEGARARLRQNPAVADFLPAEDAAATPVASAAGTDVRLVLSQPLRPAQLLLSRRQDVAGEARVLEAGGTVIPDQNTWGLMVRTSFGGDAAVSYRYALTRSGDSSPVASGNGNLRQHVSVNDRNASADLLAFDNNQSVMLMPGSYTLELTLTANGASEQHSFPINATG